MLVERVFVVAGDFLICADFAISASAGGDCYLTVCTAQLTELDAALAVFLSHTLSVGRLSVVCVSALLLFLLL